jgi:hypothetical protein
MPVSKKTSPKEVVSTKSKLVKKVVLSKPKVKVTLKKTTPIKPLVKGKKATASKTSTKAKSSAKPKAVKAADTKEVVYLPSTISLRLQEKVSLYSIWYKDNISSYAATTAKYGGYAFVLLGTLLTTFNYLIDKDYLASPAALICADDSCVEVDDSALPAGSPLITFLSSLPETISSNIDFVVRAENAKEFKVTLVSSQSGEVIIMEPSEVISETDYRFLIPYNSLSPSSYTIFAESKLDGATYKFTGPAFTIAAIEKTKPSILEIPDTILIETDLNSTSTLSSTTISSEVSTSSEETLFEESAPELPISMSLKGSNESKYLVIKTGNYLPRKVEVYSTISGSDNKVYLGAASLIQGEWIFSLSAFDLPSVNHLVFAEFSDNTDTFLSEGVNYLPTYSKAVSQETELDSDISSRKVLLALESADLALNSRENYYTEALTIDSVKEDVAMESQFGSESLRALISDTMVKNEEETNILLQRYASAAKVGRPYLVNLSDTVLKNHYEKMTKEITANTGTETLAPAINTILALRFFALKSYVVGKESEFDTATNGLFSKDSDNDGLSDFDELNTYLSNTTIPDTDMDGVVDGVEVANLFNPSISDVSSFAYLNQNIEGTNTDEVITINSVEPLIYKQITDSKDHVYAVVRGKSIPDSFVYIFNYTESSVGVIRVGQDGEFLYTLEKDLQEGPQEIVAVLVDNSGRVVSNSAKYSFVKTTNSFTAAAIAGKQPIFSIPAGENLTLTATMVASITVVSFGFILLLLGQAVQNRKKLIVETKSPKAA